MIIPLAAVVFLVDWLPHAAQQIVPWRLVNGIEMFSSNLFPAGFLTHGSATAPAACGLGLTAIGLPLCRQAERHIEMPG